MELTTTQIETLQEMDGQTFRTSFGTARNPIRVQMGRWTKGQHDRVYLNNVSRGGSLSRDIGRSVGYVDCNTGEVHGDNWHSWMQDMREAIVSEILDES